MKLSIRNFLLSLTLLVPALQQTACADNVTYLYRSWDESTKTVKTETKTANATPLRSVAKNGEWMGLGDGWYYKEGDRIRLCEGLLKGFSGTITKVDHQYKRLQITFTFDGVERKVWTGYDIVAKPENGNGNEETKQTAFSDLQT